MLLTSAMMLEWLGFAASAERLRQAVALDLVESGAQLRSCEDVTTGIIAHLL